MTRPCHLCGLPIPSSPALRHVGMTMTSMAILTTRCISGCLTRRSMAGWAIVVFWTRIMARPFSLLLQLFRRAGLSAGRGCRAAGGPAWVHPSLMILAFCATDRDAAERAAAQGRFVHVNVGRTSRTPVPISDTARLQFETLWQAESPVMITVRISALS